MFQDREPFGKTAVAGIMITSSGFHMDGPASKGFVTRPTLDIRFSFLPIMPTTTATMTVSLTGHKVTKFPVSTTTAKKGTTTKHAIATLRSLYNRAARAFLQRDMALTHSLIISAFSNLNSPTSSALDSFNSQRRKWDILRITLEATLYTSSSSPNGSLPESLQMTLRLSPPSVIATMHTRSLQLFTPSNFPRPSAEFLPPQVLVTLALASVKLECPQVGREMVEDWLNRRNPPSEEQLQDAKSLAEALEGYEKVIEVYCLHLLPRLGEWEYTREFLNYERELLDERRVQLLRTVERLHSEYIAGLDRERHRLSNLPLSPPAASASSSRTATPKVVTTIPPTPDRTASPSPSVASSSSTTSTHTAVPTRRSNHLVSDFSSTTPTPRAQSPVQPLPSRSTSGSTASTVQASTSHRQTRVTSSASSHATSPQISSSTLQPSLMVLIKSTLIPHLTRSKISFVLIMCLVSFVSYLFRLRRKRTRLLNSAGPSTPKLITLHTGDLEEVKRRLGGTGLWASAKRAVFDAVRMAGSGLT